MTATHPLDIIVTGAGLTGLTTAVLLARDGHRVTVLDRDPAPPPDSAEHAWDGWERPGVSQFRHPHLMLPRWTLEMGREVPELLASLRADGVGRANLLHLQPASVTHGWRPGDECFDTVAVRRPVLEASLARLAAATPDVQVRRGVRAHGLLATADDAVPHVGGVRTSRGDVTGDLVVDAAGRRTPVPDWVRRLGGPAPAESREPCGFVYYSRHFRSSDLRMPTGPGSVLTHHPSFSVLTLPGDHGTYCVVLITSGRDKRLRALRHPVAWTAAARTSPVAGPWVDHGMPVTGVMPIAGIEDVCRSYVRDGDPLVTGLVAVGDSATATNPSLGRGATLGLLQACALRDVLRVPPAGPTAQVVSIEEALTQRVRPLVEASLWYDRHRLGELEADALGTSYDTDDEAWRMTTTLQTGADHDPVLARAASRLAGLLAAPSEVFGDPGVQRRLAPFVGLPRYDPGGPTRTELLRVVDGAAEPSGPGRGAGTALAGRHPG